MLIHPASISDIDTPEAKKQFSSPISFCADYSAENSLCGLLPFYPFERLEQKGSIPRASVETGDSRDCFSDNMPCLLLAGLKHCRKKRYSPDW